MYANTAAHLCLQYVHHFELFRAWQFKRIDHNNSHKPVSVLSPGTSGNGGMEGAFLPGVEVIKVS